LTVTDKQTIRKKLDINHKNTHINTIQIKENKQLNTQQKQNYPDPVASYDTQPGNEVGLFYNGPEHYTGHIQVKLNSVQFIQNLCFTKFCNKKFKIMTAALTRSYVETFQYSVGQRTVQVSVMSS